MTGYASAQHSTTSNAPEAEARALPSTQLGLEVRSVNSRFLDLTFRLPEDLRQFEPALRELLGSKLKRGKLEVRASVETTSNSTIPEPTPKLLQNLTPPRTASAHGCPAPTR